MLVFCHIPVEVKVFFRVVILIYRIIHHLHIFGCADRVPALCAGLPLPSSPLLVTTGHQEICNGNPVCFWD